MKQGRVCGWRLRPLLRTRKSELTTAKKHSEALLYKVLPPAIVRRVYDAPVQGFFPLRVGTRSEHPKPGGDQFFGVGAARTSPENGFC